MVLNVADRCLSVFLAYCAVRLARSLSDLLIDQLRLFSNLLVDPPRLLAKLLVDRARLLSNLPIDGLPSVGH
jgi:hypothetical protein